VHWLNLFAKFSVTERTAGSQFRAEKNILRQRVWAAGFATSCSARSTWAVVPRLTSASDLATDHLTFYIRLPLDHNINQSWRTYRIHENRWSPCRKQKSSPVNASHLRGNWRDLDFILLRAIFGKILCQWKFYPSETNDHARRRSKDSSW